MTRAKRFARSSLHFMMGEGSVLVLTLAIVPTLVRSLGAEGYALYAFMGIMTGYMTLFTLGAAPAAVKLVSQHAATGDHPRLWRAAKLSLVAHAVGAAVAAAALVLGRGYLTSRFLHISPENLPQAHRIFAYVAAGGFCHLITLWSGAILQGFQRFDLYNGVNVLRGALIPLGCLALALSRRPLGELGVWFFSANLLVMTFGLVCAGRQLLPAFRGRRGPGGHDWTMLGWYNLSALATQLAVVINSQIDKLWVGSLFPIADLAYYVIPSSLAQRLGTVPAIVGQVVFPMASEIGGLGQKESLKRLYLKATKVILLALLPFFIVLFAYAPQLLALWLGPDFEARSTWPLRLLLLGWSASILTVVAHHVALGLGRVGSITTATAASAVSCLGLWSVLIPRYGIMGAAGGFCAAQLLVVPPFLYYVSRRLVGLSLGELLEGVLVPVGSGAVIFALAYALRSSVFHLIPLLAASTAIFAAYYGVNFALLDREERGMVRHLLRLERGT